jgi:hypothetical protein
MISAFSFTATSLALYHPPNFSLFFREKISKLYEILKFKILVAQQHPQEAFSALFSSFSSLF